MSIRIVQLGTPKTAQEGTRLGTVRRPPRGVRTSRYSADNWFDVWLPMLAPSAGLIAAARKWDLADPRSWRRFARRYESELRRPEAERLLAVLAALSHGASFSVGCYCEDEHQCHRSILRRILRAHGAKVAG